MPRGQRKGTKVRYQVREAIKSADRVLNHLMAADIVAKGGIIDGHGKFLPAGVDIAKPEVEGHPVLNEWMPTLIELVGSLKSSLYALVKKL